MWISREDIAYAITFNRVKYPALNLPSTEWVRVRASQVKEALKCQFVSLVPDLPTAHIRTELGSLLHTNTTAKLLGKDFDKSYIHETYYKHISMLMRACTFYGHEIKLSRPIKPLLAMTGSADFIAIKGSTAHIVDLKTGKWKIEANNNRQLLSYAWMLLNYVPQLDNFRLTIIQNSEVTTYKCCLKRIKQFEKEISKLSHHITFSVGENCFSCFKAVKCPYGQQLLKSFSDLKQPEIQQIKKSINNWGIVKYGLREVSVDKKVKNIYDSMLNSETQEDK